MQETEWRVKPSYYYLVALIVLVAASLGIAASLSLTLLYKMALLALVSTYGSIIIWHFGLLRAPDSIIRLTCTANGEWRIQTNRCSYEAILRGDSTVTTIVSVLRFNANKKRLPITCVIFPDSLLPDYYRRLLVAARMR
jgi:hypothetical protein